MKRNGFMTITKRAVLTLLALVLLLSYMAAYADINFDISALSDTELIELQEEVLSEMKNRGINNAIRSGTYTVGRDIKAGKYHFDCLAKSGVFIMHLYKNEDDFKNTDYIDSITCDVGGSVFLSLEDDMVLVIHDGVEGTLNPASASWMP